MHLNSLHIINYRNIASADLDLCEGINCFLGDNGARKTNIIDTIYYLSFCKSFPNTVDSQNIKDGENFMIIQGRYERRDNEEVIYCGIKRGQKKQFKRNKKDYERFSEHIGLLPLVIISPSDEELIYGGAEERRKYIDGIISQCDNDYLNALMRYNKTLQQRNALLKQLEEAETVDTSLLDILDTQLAHYGQQIFDKRNAFVEWLKPIFHNLYKTISGSAEMVEMEYTSGLQRYDLMQGLHDTHKRDITLGYTSRGVHKDDINFYIQNLILKKTGSQGQKKSFAIALKLAQFRYLTEHNGFRPILLLDDVFDKLDEKRCANLINLVAHDTFDQIFVTDTNKSHLLEILQKVNKPFRIFDVE